MSTPAKVLVLGTDPAKLDAMSSVLHHFWDVVTLTPAQFAESSAETNLAVLCDSIPEPERQEWVEALRASRPQLLIVKLNGYDSGPHASADATVDTVHGPGALVSTIYELVTERGIASRPWPVTSESAWIQ